MLKANIVLNYAICPINKLGIPARSSNNVFLQLVTKICVKMK